MNLVKTFDNLQYKHSSLSFIVAVIKRYSENRGGRNAALITYYLFLSLFPLLFWLSLIANLLNSHFPGASSTLIHGATNYFPVLGQQLDKIVHSTHDSTGGIIVSGLVTLYGVRGSAMVFKEIVNDMFMIPLKERDSFPGNWLRSVGIVVIGGGGFVLTAVGYSWALARGHGIGFKLLMGITGIVLLTLVFMAILKLSLPAKAKVHRILSGALSMAIGLGLLQLAGGWIVTHSLKHYTDFYTALFATTLGLLAWIYLEAQILLYSIEITIVAERKLWPRHLFGSGD
jgi:uncharacterized BrkB/YihY/UPF0761 family membrane protein